MSFQCHFSCSIWIQLAGASGRADHHPEDVPFWGWQDFKMQKAATMSFQNSGYVIGCSVDQEIPIILVIRRGTKISSLGALCSVWSSVSTSLVWIFTPKHIYTIIHTDTAEQLSMIHNCHNLHNDTNGCKFIWHNAQVCVRKDLHDNPQETRKVQQKKAFWKPVLTFQALGWSHGTSAQQRWASRGACSFSMFLKGLMISNEF